MLYRDDSARCALDHMCTRGSPCRERSIADKAKALVQRPGNRVPGCLSGPPSPGNGPEHVDGTVARVKRIVYRLPDGEVLGIDRVAGIASG